MSVDEFPIMDDDVIPLFSDRQIDKGANYLSSEYQKLKKNKLCSLGRLNGSSVVIKEIVAK